MTPIALIVCCISVLVAGDLVRAQANETDLISANKVAIFESELKLRSIIDSANKELDSLKDEFLDHLKNVYLRVRYNNPLEFAQAQERAYLIHKANSADDDDDDDEIDATYDANGEPVDWEQFAELEQLEYQMPMVAQLMNEQFADMLIKKYVVHRRLLKGLKFVSARLLPMETIVRLMQKYPKTYGWLERESKLDLRLKFPEMDENQYSILYGLIELRARIRAADDFVALSSDNIERILRAIQLYLIDEDDELFEANRLNPNERAHLAKFGRQMLDYYTEQARDNVAELNRRYDQLVDQWAESIMAKGADDINRSNGNNNVQLLTEFIDQFINAEMLDIDLSKAADSLSLPPTITETIVLANVPKWIPAKVLQSISEDRKLIMEHGKPIRYLLRLETSNSTEAKLAANEYNEDDDYFEDDFENEVDEMLAKRRNNRIDLARWAADASFYICKRGLTQLVE